jgi:hypothetical protein
MEAAKIRRTPQVSISQGSDRPMKISTGQTRLRLRGSLLSFLWFACAAALVTACRDGDEPTRASRSASVSASVSAPPASAVAVASAAELSCDDSMKTAFKPDANTQVTFVKLFKKGEPLLLYGNPSASTIAAPNDVCVVKLNVGPGNAGPDSAPSTSAGIGMEIWLPARNNWNGRTRSTGDGAFSGSAAISSLTELRVDIAGWAVDRGYVSSISDGGRADKGDFSIGSFGMNPDGTINTVLWKDLATRSIHELALKTRALAAAYYAKPASYAYFGGCSAGGRAGYAAAQSFPSDFNGIYVEAPSINQTQFKADQAWSTFVTQRDLKGVPLTTRQSDMLTDSTIAACDAALNGKHEGYISDPAKCTYDPAIDPSALCIASGGRNGTSSCVSKAQALAVDKMWYGPTNDGTVPSPLVDNGFSVTRKTPNHLWWGLPRGVNVFQMSQPPFSLVADGLAQVTLSLQDPTVGTTGAFLFKNATGSGEDRWKNLSYAEYAHAMVAGKVLNDHEFGNIDTNNPDLGVFRAAGGKMITLQGLSDGIVPAPGAIEYYNRASTVAGGFANEQSFHRLFLEPGRGHCDNINGFGNPGSPAPKLDQGSLFSQLGDDSKRSELFDAVVRWVETGVAPTTFIATTADKKISRPICMYPRQLTYRSGPTDLAKSYTCN